MYLLCLYLIVLLIVIILVFYSRKEGFNTETNEIISNVTTSSKIEPTTSSSYDDMDEIDFTEIENSEKTFRDEQSRELNGCIGKYVNRSIKPLRDVSEIMFSKVEDCDNIFEVTEVDSGKKYFEQMEYW
jgi:hypothetical protein